jgi:alginate O-acetyltransferase complex protein AlgI
MGGSKVRKIRLVINIFVVWMLTGIWHGANWNFVFWGITYAILICFEKLSGLPGRLNGIAKIIYRGVVLLVVNFEWVIFRADGLAAGLSYIKHMIFSCGYAAANARALFLVKENWMFLIAAILFATPVIPYIEKCVENHKVLRAVYGTIFVIVNLALFLWAVSYVVAGANNPFAYANF